MHVVTWDANYVCYHLDGAYVGQIDPTEAGWVPDGQVKYLAHSYDPTDEVIFFDHVLSDAEIKELYNNPANSGYVSTLTDGNGHGHHGALTGVTSWVDAPWGRALNLNGLAGQGVSIPDIPIPGALTVAAMVVPGAAPVGWGRVICGTYKYNGGGASQRGWLLGLTFGSLDAMSFMLFDPSGAGAYVSLSNFWALYGGTAVLVEGMFTPGVSVSIRINGAVVATAATAITSIGSSGLPIRIGTRPDASTQGMWDGLIGPIRLFTRATTGAEGKALTLYPAGVAESQVRPDVVAAQAAADDAQGDATTALTALTNIASDNVLSQGEKPDIISRNAVIIGEQAGIDAQATAYGITTEKTAYDAAVTALTAYLATLTTPVAWNNLTGNTIIVGTTFWGKFNDVYTTRTALLNAITAKAKAIANVKRRIFYVQPTPPYDADDTWHVTDLCIKRCKISKAAGQAYDAADWEIKKIGGAGITEITAGQVKTGALESTNWGAEAGSRHDLDGGIMILGGSANPRLSFDGENLIIRGTVYAENGEFTGVVNATDGIFSGTIDSGALLTLKGSASSTSQSFGAATTGAQSISQWLEGVGKAQNVIHACTGTHNSLNLMGILHTRELLHGEVVTWEVTFHYTNGTNSTHYYTTIGEDVGTQAATIIFTTGGDILLLRNIPSAPSGLQAGQIYRDGSGFLKIVL